MSPDEIDDILRCDREYKKGCKKQDIESFFSTTMDMQERKAFLADAMGHIYTELFIGNHRYGYCNRGNGTVEFWRGGQRSTGLGLYLCHEVLQRLGHTISIRSEPGKGTAVCICFARGTLVVE